MPRKGWPKESARAIQRRLNELVADRFGGVQARFVAACGLTRDTAGKWFGTAFRVPDTRTLVTVAERCEVSLDWLVLGRGKLDQPAPVSREAATARLFDAVCGTLRRRKDHDTLRVLRGLGNGPGALWRIVVDEAAELPALQDLVERELPRFRDDA